MLDFHLFKTNSWIFIDSTRVSMNFPYISQAAGLFLSDFSKVFVQGWERSVLAGSSGKGCGRLELSAS